MQPRLCRQVTIQDNLLSNSEIIEIEEGTNDLSQAELNDYVDSYTQQDLNYVDSDEDQESSSEDGGADPMQMEDLSQRTNDLRIQDDVNAHAHSHNHEGANANVPKFTYYDNQGASINIEEEEDEKQRKKQGTLTQSGFATMYRPKSDRLSISARKRKKAKIEKQTNTLTQNFERETKNKTSPPKDTKDRVYYNRSNSARGTCYVFNVGESFRINCKDYPLCISVNQSFGNKKKKDADCICKGYPDCIAVIQSFGNKKMKKNAACIVYQKIKSTFAGNVKNIEPFREFVQETNVKLNPEIFVQYKNQKTIRLEYLNEIVKDFTPPSPTSFIEYDMISGEETASFRKAGQGHGFTVVYKHIQNAAKEEKPTTCTDTMEIEFTNITKVFPDEHLLNLDLTPRKSKNEKSENVHQLVVKSAQEKMAKLFKMNNLSPTDSALLKELQRDFERIIEKSMLCSSKADAEIKKKPKKKSQKCRTHEDSDKIKVLDVFAGIGGMSQGFEKAGFDVQWAVENCTTAAGTLKINHKNTFVFEEEVQAWFQKMDNTLDLMNREKGNESNPYAQVLMFAKHAHFSPPCQAFSDANSAGGCNDALNASLTLLCIKIIKMLYSCGTLKSASMENVTGLLNQHRGHEEYLKTFVSSLVGLGMDVRVSILNSKRYGDPQNRNRVFVTAVKADLVLNEFPVATHGGDKKDKDGNMLPGVVTCSDALDDLEKVTPVSGNGLVELQREDGTSYFVKDHASSGTDLKSEMMQLKRDEPSNTIIRKPNVKHYSLHRTLTLREQARLQSLPDDFEFNGARGLIISGIGNAVPVLTSTEVAKSIKSSYR